MKRPDLGHHKSEVADQDENQADQDVACGAGDDKKQALGHAELDSQQHRGKDEQYGQTACGNVREGATQRGTPIGEDRVDGFYQVERKVARPDLAANGMRDLGRIRVIQQLRENHVRRHVADLFWLFQKQIVSLLSVGEAWGILVAANRTAGEKI